MYSRTPKGCVERGNAYIILSQIKNTTFLSNKIGEFGGKKINRMLK